MTKLTAKKETRGKVTFEFSNQLILTLAKSDPRCYDYHCGEEYDERSLRELIHTLELQKAEHKLSDMLARGPKSIGQAKQSLKQKGFNPEIVTEIVSRFIRAGFLDDRRFAQDTIRFLLANNPAGKSFIRATLLKKSVSAEIIDDVVAICFAEVDEVELAERILRKRWWRLRELPLETARQKAYTQLARKAIGYDACRKAFDRLAAEESAFAASV